MKKVSISQYAKLCAVKRQAIHLRIKNEEIIPELVWVGDKHYYVIDVEKYPPILKRKGGRKSLQYHLDKKEQEDKNSENPQ